MLQDNDEKRELNPTAEEFVRAQAAAAKVLGYKTIAARPALHGKGFDLQGSNGSGGMDALGIGVEPLRRRDCWIVYRTIEALQGMVAR